MTDKLIERLYDRMVCSPAQNSCRNDFALEQAAARIEELEAKLEKAVEALEWVKFGGGPNGESYHELACQVLAELKDTKC